MTRFRSISCWFQIYDLPRQCGWRSQWKLPPRTLKSYRSDTWLTKRVRQTNFTKCTKHQNCKKELQHETVTNVANQVAWHPSIRSSSWNTFSMGSWIICAVFAKVSKKGQESRNNGAQCECCKWRRTKLTHCMFHKLAAIYLPLLWLWKLMAIVCVWRWIQELLTPSHQKPPSKSSGQPRDWMRGLQFALIGEVQVDQMNSLVVTVVVTWRKAM